MKHTHKLLLNWDAFDEAIVAGAHELQTHEWVRDGKCSGIYGVPRGGLVVAVALSHYLHVPLILEPKNRCIVVDDVVETGETIARVRTLYGYDMVFWTWITKDRSLIERYHRAIDPDVWLVFPWEDWLRADDDAKSYQARRSTVE